MLFVGLTVRRKRSPTQCLVFSDTILDYDEVFEVKIDETDPLFSAGLKIGLTAHNISDVSKISHDLGQLSGDTWWVEVILTSDWLIHNNTDL